MSKQKLFQNISDIDGKICKYPVNNNHYVFLNTPDCHYIYACYTKQDLSGSKIIKLSEQGYIDAQNNAGSDRQEINFEDLDHVLDFMLKLKLLAAYQDLTVEDILKLKGKLINE